jgi:hypothetical protein
MATVENLKITDLSNETSEIAYDHCIACPFSSWLGRLWLQCCHLGGNGSFRIGALQLQMSSKNKRTDGRVFFNLIAAIYTIFPRTCRNWILLLSFFSISHRLEVGLTCRPMTARRPKEGQTCEHAASSVVLRRNAHQSNRLERSSSGPGSFQSFDRIGIDNRSDSSLAAFWTLSVNPTLQIEKINPARTSPYVDRITSK